jgi:hypothetical protein
VLQVAAPAGGMEKTKESFDGLKTLSRFDKLKALS